MKHTPGPWSYASSDKGHAYMVQHLSPGRSGAYFATITVDSCHRTHEAREIALANARLIAAAPDLLAACRAAREELRLLQMKDTAAVYDPTIRARLDAAISKAEAP